MHYWQLNRCVFSCFLKTPSVMSGGVVALLLTLLYIATSEDHLKIK